MWDAEGTEANMYARSSVFDAKAEKRDCRKTRKGARENKHKTRKRGIMERHIRPQKSSLNRRKARCKSEEKIGRKERVSKWEKKDCLSHELSEKSPRL